MSSVQRWSKRWTSAIQALAMALPAWLEAGCWVRITGLAKAPQHNGKAGYVVSHSVESKACMASVPARPKRLIGPG